MGAVNVDLAGVIVTTCQALIYFFYSFVSSHDASWSLFWRLPKPLFGWTGAVGLFVVSGSCPGLRKLLRIGLSCVVLGYKADIVFVLRLVL